VLSRDSAREDVAVDCANRRGRPITCHVQATPLAADSGDVTGAIVMMKEDARTPEP
jgi:hypothetical protein